MPTTREQDLEIFGMWLHQLNHEDYLIVARTALAMVSQPAFIVAYVLTKHFGYPLISQILIWSNLVISIITFISILAAFRVYLETRVRLRPLLQRHPDFPMRRLPNIRPGLGLYCPVGMGLIMVVIWASFLYVEAPEGNQQKAALAITALLALAGIVFAIGVGTTLGKDSLATDSDHLGPTPRPEG
jgi:hypothetical protein